MGAAYIDCLPDEDTGTANVMLSYTWGYSVKTIINTLVHHCKQQDLKRAETCVWVCFVNNNREYPVHNNVRRG